MKLESVTQRRLCHRGLKRGCNVFRATFLPGPQWSESSSRNNEMRDDEAFVLFPLHVGVSRAFLSISLNIFKKYHININSTFVFSEQIHSNVYIYMFIRTIVHIITTQYGIQISQQLQCAQCL